MQQAAYLQFERMLGELVRWRDVPESERSPAPAWWWGPALEMRELTDPLPDEWRDRLGLKEKATCADGAACFLDLLAGQTSLPWPDHFPRKPTRTENEAAGA